MTSLTETGTILHDIELLRSTDQLHRRVVDDHRLEVQVFILGSHLLTNLQAPTFSHDSWEQLPYFEE